MSSEKKSRARKPKTPKNAAASLLAAIKFVSIAQRNEGTTYQTHCALYDNYLSAFDGAIAAGCKAEAPNCCPHTLKALAALSRCGEEAAINLTENGRLSVKSGAFRALIPCVNFEDVIYSGPDEPIGPLSSALVKAFELVAPLCTQDAQEVYMAAILFSEGSIIASNGAVLFEVWHGLNLPPGLLMPKAAVSAVIKANKPLAHFGYAPGKSFTFWFEDESWIKTQLYDAEYPNVYEILNQKTNAWPIPAGFYDAVDAVVPFSENDSVYFAESAIVSHKDSEISTSYLVPGLPSGSIFAGKYLKMLQSVAERIDFATYPSMAYFFGENVRGVVMGKTV